MKNELLDDVDALLRLHEQHRRIAQMRDDLENNDTLHMPHTLAKLDHRLRVERRNFMCKIGRAIRALN
jgi:hypothetical protein